MEEKCEKEMWALGAYWYCVLEKGHEGNCKGELPDVSLDHVLKHGMRKIAK